MERCRIDFDATIPSTLATVFEPALREALRDRPRVHHVAVRAGRNDHDVVVWISAAGRNVSLPLFFPEAPALGPQDIVRIVRNVLEGMGPAAP